MRMMSESKNRLLFFMAIVLITGCTTQQSLPATISEPTFQQAPTQIPTSTQTPRFKPTLTPTPTNSPEATATLVPTPTATNTPLGGGGLIAFSSIRVGSRFANPQSDLVILNPNNAALTWLTHLEDSAVRDSPSWSPEGDRLVYTKDNLLYTIQIESVDEIEFESPFGGGVYQPAWSGQNEFLMIYAPFGKYPQIWHSVGEKSDWKAITPKIPFQFDPVWSPDGKSYAFSGAPGTIFSEWFEFFRFGFRLTFYDVKARDIYVVDIVTGQMDRITDRQEDESQPAWSPDGQKLAFVSIEKDDNPEIFIINRDGTNLTQVTNSLAQDIYPTWSPDGTMLAFASDRLGNFEIFIVSTAGGNPTRMTDNLMNDYQPIWSQAGNETFFGSTSSNQADLRLIKPRRRSIEEIVRSLNQDGIITSDQGRRVRLMDFYREWAQIGWYQYYLTGEQPANFIVRADARWESDSDRADWHNSGCGFVFREKDVYNHYLAYLGMDGLVRIGQTRNGTDTLLGVSSHRYPLDTPADRANLMLVVDENKMAFFVNGLQMLTRSDTSAKSGNLALTMLSGTNKGFGTRCEMENIELWIIEK
jgi:Tol biopolymer transport system component